MRLLFLKHSLAWPRSSGHDVHCFHMMQALERLGHDIGLVTVHEVAPQAIDGIRLAMRQSLEHGIEPSPNGHSGRLSGLQERFRAFYGIDARRLAAVRSLAESWQADAVVAVGLDAPVYLGGLQDCLRVWYAADEWMWHHVSQLRLGDPAFGENLREALVKGLYERAFAASIDRVWVVSESERSAMRWLAGMRAVDVLPNGVDGSYFHPMAEEEIATSVVFWGRLDFGPNIQALDWFCRRVWPALRRQVRDAQFTILGFRPSPAVRTLAAQPGVRLVADLDDIRKEVCRHTAVVLPFVSGGGIKNKLLEAAALARPIVASRRALGGLRRGAAFPLIQPLRPADWVREILALWREPARRRRLGVAARRWVLEHHTWAAAAQEAVTGLQESLQGNTRA